MFSLCHKLLMLIAVTPSFAMQPQQPLRVCSDLGQAFGSLGTAAHSSGQHRGRGGLLRIIRNCLWTPESLRRVTAYGGVADVRRDVHLRGQPRRVHTDQQRPPRR